MDQAEFELKLKIWKDLAVSKQMLMRAATDALGLSPDCNSDELKSALEIAIERGNKADVRVEKAQDEARKQVDEAERKLAASERARQEAEAAIETSRAAQQNAEQQLAAASAAHSKEVEAARAQTIEKEKALKAINVALADTPKNVIKKLKELKKQKLDEANARKRVEGELRNLRKDKQSLEERINELQATLESAAQLVESHRALHKFSNEQYDKLKALGAEGDDLAAVPALDEASLEAITQQAESGAKNSKLASAA